jgi:hypothetical protein
MKEGKRMNENIRRLLDGAADRLTSASEIDNEGDRALVEALGISGFDLAQLDAGRITAPVAAVHDALAGVRAAAGAAEDEGSGLPWIDQAKADGDLSRTAKNVAGWLDKNGDGEVRLQAIGTDIHASVKAVRDALDELAGWAYVDLRPSIRTGAIRVKIMR